MPSESIDRSIDPSIHPSIQSCASPSQVLSIASVFCSRVNIPLHLAPDFANALLDYVDRLPRNRKESPLPLPRRRRIRKRLARSKRSSTRCSSGRSYRFQTFRPGSNPGRRACLAASMTVVGRAWRKYPLGQPRSSMTQRSAIPMVPRRPLIARVYCPRWIATLQRLIWCCAFCSCDGSSNLTFSKSSIASL